MKMTMKMINGSKSLLVAGLCCASLFALAGCSCSTKTVRPNKSPELTADEVWRKMVAAYQSATSYRDSGTVTLSYKQAGHAVEDKADVKVTFVRPNKLRMRAYHAEVASDGEILRAKVFDEGTNDIDGQIVVRPAPVKLSIDDLLSDPLLRETLSNAVVTSELGRISPQLELLLTAKPFASAARDGNRKRLPDESIDDRRCFRLELATAMGGFVFWIDHESFVLRRLEFPQGALLEDLANAPDITDVKLVADFAGAEFGGAIADSTFALEIPVDAKQVRFFVPPPRPLPSELFGQKAGDFSLLIPSGGHVTRESLAGKIAVLVWFNDDPACESGLRQLEAVYQKLKDDERFSFWAVCTEPSTISHGQLGEMLKRWQVSIPLARDSEAHGRDVFHIQAAPTLLVLDAEGGVQVVEVGANPRLSHELPAVLEKVAAGENVSDIVLAEAQRERHQYERQLAIASSANAGSPTVVEIVETPIKERSEPKKLTLTKRWSNGDVREPGNVLVYERDQQPRVLVVTAGRDVTELDGDGRVVATHELKLPDDGKISFLRTAVDKSGRRFFAASGLFGKQALVFDDHWKQVASYPPAAQPHDGIRDLQLVDLDGDGDLELYVGFWGAMGVHRVSLTGEREWINREIPAVLSLAISAPNRKLWQKLLVTGEPGTIRPIGDLGTSDSAVTVPNWGINQLIGGKFPFSRATSFCGVSYTSEGNIVVVALDRDLAEQWNYPLPPGLPRTQIEFVTSGDLLDFEFQVSAEKTEKVGQWVFGAADGSIHIVSADGDFADHFNYGEMLTGIATAQFGDAQTLLVATPTSVTAWRVERRSRE